MTAPTDTAGEATERVATAMPPYYLDARSARRALRHAGDFSRPMIGQLYIETDGVLVATDGHTLFAARHALRWQPPGTTDRTAVRCLSAPISLGLGDSRGHRAFRRLARRGGDGWLTLRPGEADGWQVWSGPEMVALPAVPASEAPDGSSRAFPRWRDTAVPSVEKLATRTFEGEISINAHLLRRFGARVRLVPGGRRDAVLVFPRDPDAFGLVMPMRTWDETDADTVSPERLSVPDWIRAAGVVDAGGAA